jgi:predicted amidophosphoribosyltransferase
MAILNKMTLTNKIYSKRCPECHKDNLESSAFCWNCNYEFPDQVAETAHQGHSWSNFFVTLALIAALVIFVLIILDAIHK